ncbi:hypothetical protein R5R35_011540 [Gryllus longicercus]|uniref:Phosphatidylinositol N-acetylglucosaminyltransferase subunit P n=1 Tax=Gryllus longicercus TaxID=2509291 RepID=A0AAN9VYS0_9ORTH
MPEHTPAPTPSRSVYGFVLYLSSWTAFILYVIWAFVPDNVLHLVGVSYLPQKYWAVALPIYVGVSVAVFVFIYPALNLMLTPPFNDLRTICDSHAVDVSVKPKQTGIPPVSDIPISDVCKHLYLNNY